jgi:hypothetical protein
MMHRTPSTLRHDYIEDLAAHAEQFAAVAAERAGAAAFCDSTPWNLLLAQWLAQRLPDAVFFLCVRHPAGVLQSLERSYAAGFRWAGSSPAERAGLYRSFYERVAVLPRARTVMFDYDSFCASPEAQLRDFLDRAAPHFGELPSAFDLGPAAESHAGGKGSGPPVATVGRNGELLFQSRASFDADAWTAVREEMLPIVQPGIDAIRQRFPNAIVALHPV